MAGNRSVARALTALGGAVLLLGTADSMAGAYLVLFASQQAGLSPVEVGVFVSAPALGGLVVSTLAGRGFDRRPNRRWAIGCALAGALGFALLTTTTAFPLLVLIAVTLLAALQAVFPQLFALARAVLGDSGPGRRGAPLLRSAWSLAWALGPLAGAALLAARDYDALLWAAAGTAALVAASVTLTPAPGPRPQHESADQTADQSADPTVPRRRLALLVTGVTLFFLAMYAGSIALPLYVTGGLGQPAGVVGVLYSACAAVEVVAALLLAVLPQRVSQPALVLGGMAALAGYFAVTVAASDITLLLVGQLARGVAIALVGAAGIRLFQDLLHPAVGRGTTLFANATTAGSLLAGVLAGLSAQAWGSATTLTLCAVTAALGALVFLTGIRG